MRLSSIFPPERIALDVKAEDKEGLFEELVDFLIAGYRSNSREEILEAILERERKMSTGIKQGIAIPHGKTDAVDRELGALGISKRGVDYDALDGEPVHLFFLLVSSESDPENHLSILKKIAYLIESPHFYNEVLTAETREDVSRILVEYEG
jgi:PTS system fructose-specific IIC component/PTS system nitrogen regulatory IIA component